MHLPSNTLNLRCCSRLDFIVLYVNYRSVVFQKSEESPGCCMGRLGYSTAYYQAPYPCSKSGCCNQSETVAVIPVDEGLGFELICMVKTLCMKYVAVIIQA